MSANIAPSASSSGVSGESSPPRLVWVNVAATVAGVLTLVAVLVALHLGHLYDIFDSDTAYLPLVLEDILEDPANFRHWYPPTTSFYFPEWILFGLPYLITRSFYFSMAAVIVLHTLILFFIVYAINRQIDRSQAWVASVVATMLLLLLALHDGYVLGYKSFLSTFRIMLYSLWHYGTFLICLVSLVLFIKLQTRSYTSGQYALRVNLLGVLVFLTVMSDQIMLVWFSGPAIATLGYHWLTTRGTTRGATSHTTQTRRIYFTMGVIAVTSIAGKLTYPLTVVHDFATGFTRISLRGMLEDIVKMTANIGYNLSSFPIINYYIVGLHLLVLVLLRHKRLSGIPAPLRFTMVYTLMTFIVVLASILVVSSPFERRYFLPTYILPIILAPSLGVYWFRHTFTISTRRISYAMLMVAGVLLQVTALKIIQKNDEIKSLHFAYTFTELRCIDQVIARYNLRHGVGGYFYAKALQAMSSHDIEVAQYINLSPNLALEKHLWMTSDQYFTDSYDFAIAGIDSVTKNFNQEWRHIFLRDHPPPAHRVVCGSKEVFIYPNGGLVMNATKTK